MTTSVLESQREQPRHDGLPHAEHRSNLARRTTPHTCARVRRLDDSGFFDSSRGTSSATLLPPHRGALGSLAPGGRAHAPREQGLDENADGEAHEEHGEEGDRVDGRRVGVRDERERERDIGTFAMAVRVRRPAVVGPPSTQPSTATIAASWSPPPRPEDRGPSRRRGAGGRRRARRLPRRRGRSPRAFSSDAARSERLRRTSPMASGSACSKRSLTMNEAGSMPTSSLQPQYASRRRALGVAVNAATSESESITTMASGTSPRAFLAAFGASGTTPATARTRSAALAGPSRPNARPTSTAVSGPRTSIRIRPLAIAHSPGCACEAAPRRGETRLHHERRHEDEKHELQRGAHDASSAISRPTPARGQRGAPPVTSNERATAATGVRGKAALNAAWQKQYRVNGVLDASEPMMCDPGH